MPENRAVHEIMWGKYCTARQTTDDNVTGTLLEDQYIFVIMSRSVLLRVRNVSGKISRENQNTHFVFSNFFPKIVPFMR